MNEKKNCQNNVYISGPDVGIHVGGLKGQFHNNRTKKEKKKVSFFFFPISREELAWIRAVYLDANRMCSAPLLQCNTKRYIHTKAAAAAAAV